MSKFHINGKGNAEPCRATVGACPFGDLTEHFGSKEEARAHYENTQSVAGVLQAVKRSKFFKKAVVVGSMVAMAIPLTGCGYTGIAAEAETVPQAPPPATEELSAQEVPVEEAFPEETTLKEGMIDELNGYSEVTQGAWASMKDWWAENGDTIKSEGASVWDQLKSEMAAQGFDASSLGLGGATTSVPIDTSGIYFQGKPITPSAQEVAQAQADLNALVVRPEMNNSYNREEQYGRGFKTGIAGAVEHRDVPNAIFNNPSPQARVSSGSFIDPYTGETVVVTGGDSYDADIDHLVPLAEAHRSGAAGWTIEQSKAFANDLDNLVYTASAVNRSKSDADAANWIPSYAPGQCRYAVQQITVKKKYNLSVDSAEQQALASIINTRCTS